VSPSENSEVKHVAALGGGLIGRSWTALFLAAGRSVAVFDPDPTTERRVRETVESAWPVLQQLGLARTTDPESGLTICSDPRGAVDSAQFVQESIPEQIALKHELYARIEPVLSDAPDEDDRVVQRDDLFGV
jgi:carnitine 3-dehydrogenase